MRYSEDRSDVAENGEAEGVLTRGSGGLGVSARFLFGHAVANARCFADRVFAQVIPDDTPDILV